MLLLLSQQSTDMEEAAERRDRDNEMQTEIDGLRESLKQLKAQRPHPDRAGDKTQQEATKNAREAAKEAQARERAQVPLSIPVPRGWAFS